LKYSNYKLVALYENFSMIVASLYENKHEMTMIVKKFKTYVSPRKLGLSLRKIHYSPGKYIFPRGTIMFPRRRNFQLP
jgi:hypothetical protein